MLARRLPHRLSLTARSLSSSAAGVLTRLGLASSSPLPGVYDGTWAASGSLHASINPATGEQIAQVQQASPEDVERTIVKAREAYRGWRGVAPPKRGEVLRQIRGRLEENIEDLGTLVTMEMGKIKSEGKGEVQEFVDVMDYAVGLSRGYGGTVVPSEREKHFITEVANPLGVVGVISAFNFPVAVYGWNFSLAMITGNASIWKPAQSTPLSAIATTKIIASVLEEHKLPGALSSLLCGGGEAGAALVSDKRVDLLSFTGSEERGRLVGMEVAGRFGKSLLELGGNNAAIVLPDANLPLALRTILFSALGTAGQRCTSTRRLFLHSSIAPEFLASLSAAYRSTSTRLGDPMDAETLVGPLHARAGVDKFVQAVKEVKEQGGEILVGGNVRTMEGALGGGNWVEPTIAFFGKEGAPVMKRETFAPILFVQTFETLEEAIELNNSVEQGLSSSLFTRDMSSAFQWIGPSGSDCGIVNVNGSTSGAEIGAPFGGNKSTGWGRESGGDAWKQYCRWSSCTLNWSDELGLAQGVKFETRSTPSAASTSQPPIPPVAPTLSPLLYVGGVSPSVPPSLIREIHHNAETEYAADGEVLRRFDYVSIVSPAAFRPSELVPLRQLSDQLADQVVEFLDLKAGQDGFAALEVEMGKESVEPCVATFWEEVNCEPPVGVSAFGEGKGEEGELERGQRVFWKYSGPIFTALLHFSLAGGFSSPRLGATMRETGYLTSKQHDATYRRLLETTLFVLDAMTDMTVGEGRGWKSAVRVRLLHAQVRRRIAQKKGRLNTYDSDVSGVPISQADLATVLGSFMIAPLWSMRRTGIILTPNEESSYQAAWRHVGFYLGIDPSLLIRCYGSSFATAETSFASLAFDAFPEEVPLDPYATPTYGILQAVSSRPPRSSKVGYHCEYSRRLLGPRLADQLAIPRGTARERIGVEFDVWSSWLMIAFGRKWREGWEKERVALFSQIIELLVVWQLGERRTNFAWREESKRADKFGKDEGEEPGIKMGREVGLDVKRRWKWLLAELVGVVAVGGAGLALGVGLVAREVYSRM